MTPSMNATRDSRAEATASDGATPSVRCAFDMPACEHAAVFHDEYLRTNRTNHTKIMRCFPHCCPGHRERSYCGTSLYVRIHCDSPLVDNRLVVLGRFRPAHTKALDIGECVSLRSIRASLQTADPSKGQWIESRRSPLDTQSVLYEINPNGRWFYPWGGAATLAMRSTQHVFEAVVFYHARASHLEVVAQIASPPFKLKSFRRSITQSGKKKVATDQPRQSEDEVTEAAPRQRRAKKKAKTRTATPTTRTSRASAVTIARITHASSDGSDEGPSPSSNTTSVATTGINAEPASGPASSEVLGSILRWLSELPASGVGSRLMLKWQNIVQDACTTKAAARRYVRKDRQGLVPILSALDLFATSQSPLPASTAEPSQQRAASPLDTIDAAVRMLLHEWLEVDSSQRAFRCISSSGKAFPPSGDELTATHARWLSEVAARARRYVDTHTGTSWSQLVETTSRYEAQHSLSSTTADGSEFSFRSFVAQYRQCNMRQAHLRRHNPTLRGNKRRRTGPSQARHSTDMSPASLLDSSPLWICRTQDVSFEADDVSQHALSVLTIVQFWKHLSCLRFDYSPGHELTSSPARLSVVSMFNSYVNEGSFTRLTLDGQYRWFNCLPSGEPTVGTTLMGYVVGDYVGRATSAGTIHITTYLWPATTEASLAFAWHWTLDATSLLSGSSSSVVSVVVESASVARTPHAMETMSMAEKLQWIERWQHSSELRLLYTTQ